MAAPGGSRLFFQSRQSGNNLHSLGNIGVFIRHDDSYAFLTHMLVDDVENERTFSRFIGNTVENHLHLGKDRKNDLHPIGLAHGLLADKPHGLLPMQVIEIVIP